MTITALKILTCGGLVLALGACTETKLRLNPDFGEAVHQDTLAQVSDPDAHYAGDPPPASNGARVGGAQDRYAKGEVKTPVSTSTASVSAGSGQ